MIRKFVLIKNSSFTNYELNECVYDLKEKMNEVIDQLNQKDREIDIELEAKALKKFWEWVRKRELDYVEGYDEVGRIGFLMEYLYEKEIYDLPINPRGGKKIYQFLVEKIKEVDSEKTSDSLQHE